jgi:SAM-dependent methyltransferase
VKCRFCNGSVGRVEGAYAECSDCSVLISTVDPSPYDGTYYYAQRNKRSSGSLVRAAKLYSYFKDYLLGDCLDFGCNDGSFVAFASLKGVNCAGVDINEDALDVARAAGGGTFLKLEDLRGLYFNVVTAFDVIEHFDEPSQFFKLVSGCLTCNGRVILTTPNKNSKWCKMFGSGWHGYGIPQYHRLIISERFLRCQLHCYGFEAEKVFSVRPVGRFAWKLLVASGYRLRTSLVSKLAALPMSLAKLVGGQLFVGGEEDTLCIIARRL